MYTIYQGSDWSPLRVGPLKYDGAAVDLSGATCAVQLVHATLGEQVSFADGAATGLATGIIEFTLPTDLEPGDYTPTARFAKDGKTQYASGKTFRVKALLG